MIVTVADGYTELNVAQGMKLTRGLSLFYRLRVPLSSFMRRRVLDMSSLLKVIDLVMQSSRTLLIDSFLFLTSSVTGVHENKHITV